LDILGTYRFPEFTSDVVQNRPVAVSSPVSLADLQKQDGTLTLDSRRGSIGSYEGSVVSKSSSSQEDVPALTLKTTVESSETGIVAEIRRVKEQLKRGKSVLKYLTELLGAGAERLPPTTDLELQGDSLILQPGQPCIDFPSNPTILRTNLMEDIALLETARPKPEDQQLPGRNKRRAPASVMPKSPSISSASSSRRAPKPKQRRVTSPNAPVMPETDSRIEWDAGRDSDYYFVDYEFRFEDMLDYNQYLDLSKCADSIN
jgi:hypothetical protein